MNDLLPAVVGAVVTALLFIARDVSRGIQDRRALTHRASLDSRAKHLTPPTPTTDEGSFTRDQWDRIHARAKGLRANVEGRSNILSAFMSDYDDVLVKIGELNFGIEEFVLPKQLVHEERYMGQGRDLYIDGHVFRAKLDGLMHYMEAKRLSWIPCI